MVNNEKNGITLEDCPQDFPSHYDDTTENVHKEVAAVYIPRSK